MKKLTSFVSFLLCALLLAALAGCSAPHSFDEEQYPNSMAAPEYSGDYGNEEYDDTREQPFKDVSTSPLSTFSADVDTASYSNMRRFIRAGKQPVGIRIEELINYFDYDYPAPSPNSEHPFSVTTEVAPCPWNPNNQLVMIGVQGQELENSKDIANNIVFLLDVSGSMDEPNKLPLLQKSFKMLVEERLDENDIVSIVTYAGSDRVVASGVRGDEKHELNRLIDDLWASGSTAGSCGIERAYELAREYYIEGGNNRVILATDGDFNVGPSSTQELTELIERERKSGVFISVLGFGMGNLKDNMMETIADNGNGNYAYIDTIAEARKVLVDEFDSTMFTIAKDLKLQIEFNPNMVAQYRLIGYNNRRLENEDFENDKKDAGDIGAGHSVTAFYELVPAMDGSGDSNLRYQEQQNTGSSDYLYVKLRYKLPDGEESILVEHAVPQSHYREEMSENMGFASAVVEFGLILFGSDYRAESNTSSVLERAQKHLGEDAFGLRTEFTKLVERYMEYAE